MLSSIRDHLTRLENIPELASQDAVINALRPLGLADFGLVMWYAPFPDWPRLSSYLPTMPARDLQLRWTGAEGTELLLQSLTFVRSCSENYTALTGQALRDTKILDFGCGYGRYLRLFSYYTSAVSGCDPWDQALDHCRAAGLGDRVRKSDALPDRLPFDEEFDFAFAFSVFTHLNQKAATLCLKSLRQVVRPSGVLCITIRPPEYWHGHFQNHNTAPPGSAERFIAAHHAHGFAFFNHGAKPDDTGATYGDASMTLDHLERIAAGWRVMAVDRALDDQMQQYVFLKAV